MRHGNRADQLEQDCAELNGLKCISGARLGCYFCNDITAPGNVSKNTRIFRKMHAIYLKYEQCARLKNLNVQIGM